jgi:hypothetical protein
VTHRPDLGAHLASGPVAVEVELQRKSATRLRGVCEMDAALTGDGGPLIGVIYVTDRPDVAAIVTNSTSIPYRQRPPGEL